MSKRKAIMSSQPSPRTHKKLKKSFTYDLTQPKLLDESSSEDDSDGGVNIGEPCLKINENFAKKFEYNKKREELQKLEDKYSRSGRSFSKLHGDKYDEDSEFSDEDEEEDDVGVLATEALDAEISTTLQAIRSKDPVVYDEKFSFYKQAGENQTVDEENELKKSRPMYLRDYHRENLLKGNIDEDGNEELMPQTFAQKQEELQNSIIKEMHAAVDDESDDCDSIFLVPRIKPDEKLKSASSHESKAEPVVDVTTADEDPEKFLSNFMATRAWIPSKNARFQPLESDDESEEERAEIFESAYNLRFEDPSGSNEVLRSYARNIVASKSVRREEKKGRKKHRDALREKRDAERRQLEEEKARLKRLKTEEMEERLKMIKKAAGIREKTLAQDQIFRLLDEAWDNEKWTDQMSKYFDEEYYADRAAESDSELISKEDCDRKKKVKKPKWDDDIDISDILPDFKKGADQRQFKLSESNKNTDDSEGEQNMGTLKGTFKVRNSEKKVAKSERTQIENLVESHLDFDIGNMSKKRSRFRYRETSPVSFGLTAQDILMAPDSSLNQIVGLKKLASFRDAEKKRRDQKNLSKKARLRQWRKETFGNENGPEIVIGPHGANKEDDTRLNIIEKAKKKTRSRKKKKQISQEI